jgi:Family of unknown function (DUF6876)
MTTTITKDKLTASDLSQFTGSETWYRHSLVRNVTYTQGVQYMAETGGAYWLIDKIATNQLDKRIRKEEFQVWKLRLDKEGNGATLRAEDGNGHVVHNERIDYTDFPLPEIDVWFTDNVILLPSEY